jgi:prephenate dehydrogenase
MNESDKQRQSEPLQSFPLGVGSIVTIIGIGLIGGSFALVLKDKGLATKIIGVDNNGEHQKRALELGIVDEVLSLDVAIAKSKLIVLAVPVDALGKILPAVLDQVEDQVVIDMGSTKENVILSVADHPKRKRFVASHPMWGTEFSGPGAAVRTAFANKAVVICDSGNSDPDALQLVTDLYRQIGMHIIYMDAADHDLHAAYISHISHITSFALANTVLEKEKEEDAIFELASGGFESTVRLAKSNAATWVPIFRQNRENVLDVLNEHISQLRKFKSCLEKENYKYLEELIESANGIRRILR